MNQPLTRKGFYVVQGKGS